MEVCQAFYLPFFGYYAGKTKIFFVFPHTESGLALSLFVALALGADHTITLPFLLITLHLSHIGFMEGLTFMVFFSLFILEAALFSRHTRHSAARAETGALRFRAISYDLLRQVILPLVRSYGLISSFTVSPSMIRM